MQDRSHVRRRPVVEPLEDRTLMALNSGLEMGINDASIVEGNSGAQAMRFSVVLSGPTIVPMSVQWSTQDGTATAGQDYAGGNGIVYFKVGDSSATITIAIAGDTLNEGNETFKVNIFNTFAATITRPTATGTIVDDDQPVVTLTAPNPNASEAGPKPGAFVVSRTGPTTDPLTVRLSIGGSARNGVDYRTLPTTVVIPAGRSSLEVRVRPVPDSNPNEGTEVVNLALRPGTGYLLGSSRASVKIADRETTPPAARMRINPGIHAPTSRGYYAFRVQYGDNKAMNLASVGNGDLLVTGPNGYSQLATLVGKVLSGNHRAVMATYTVPAPGGGWDATDNGDYVISVRPRQVVDAAGNPIAAGGLASFQVDIGA